MNLKYIIVRILMQEDCYGCLRMSSSSSTEQGRFEEFWLNLWQGQKTYLFSKTSSLSLGPIQPQTQQILGVISPLLKWLGCESDQSPPSQSNYTSTPSFTFMECIGAAFTCGKKCQWNTI